MFSAIELLCVEHALASPPSSGPLDTTRAPTCSTPYDRTETMASVSPGHPESAVDGDPATRVPQPRAPANDAVREGDPRNAIAQARVRESATRNNTAAELFDAGRYDEAVPLFEQAFASCRSTLGADHPDTLTVGGNLAVAYLSAGNRRKGIKLIAGNLAARERVFGDDHPETLTARNALAVAHRINGDADAAVQLAKQVAVQRSRTLGPAHVDTLTSRMGLALAMAAAGHLTTAHGLVASTMSDAESTLGAEHEHTLALLECGESNGLLRREV